MSEYIKYTNSGIEIFDRLPERRLIAIVEPTMQHLQTIANGTECDRTPESGFDIQVAYAQPAEIMAPCAVPSLSYCRVLGYTALLSGYGREFAIIDLQKASQSKNHTELAQERIRYFANRGVEGGPSGSFIFIGNVAIGSKSAQKRARQVQATIQETDLPSARILSAVEGDLGATGVVLPFVGPVPVGTQAVEAQPLALAA